MLNLFNKGSKVKAGKQTNADMHAAQGNASAEADKKKQKKPFSSLSSGWHKLNSMDRKQAYTWGALAVVGLVALLTLGSAMGSSDQDDFSDFETRGYDLTNMPFSTDEAEQYLLASKYPDMQGQNSSGLYTPGEKAARQAKDAQNLAEEQSDTAESGADLGSGYTSGRYYGGGASGGAGTRTQVSSLNSANLKGASGSGINSTFGATGDFSNFRSQERGNDKAPVKVTSGNARKALFQMATASRAAAGLKDNKLVNTKKAMMGGNVKGSNAFTDDSGAVNLKNAAGLTLDTDAPVSSADLGGLPEALQNAKESAEEEAAEEDELQWWQEMLIDIANQAATQLLSAGMNSLQDKVFAAQAARNAEIQVYADACDQAGIAYQKKGWKAFWSKDMFNSEQTINYNNLANSKYAQDNPGWLDTIKSKASAASAKASSNIYIGGKNSAVGKN